MLPLVGVYNYSSSAGRKMSQLCFPYSSGITCVCDAQQRIFKCFPEISRRDQHGSLQQQHSLQQHQLGAEGSFYKRFCDFMDIFNGR